MAVKERVGLVVSDKMDKTVVVAVENRAPHPKYRKIVVQTKRYKVHDEENKCKVGDRVRILETRPMSRTKRWTVAEILSHSFIAQPKTVAQPSVHHTDQQVEPEPLSTEAGVESVDASVTDEPITDEPITDEPEVAAPDAGDEEGEA
jgi:small subunit ribosomal protein S17